MKEQSIRIATWLKYIFFTKETRCEFDPWYSVNETRRWTWWLETSDCDYNVIPLVASSLKLYSTLASEVAKWYKKSIKKIGLSACCECVVCWCLVHNYCCMYVRLLCGGCLVQATSKPHPATVLGRWYLYDRCTTNRSPVETWDIIATVRKKQPEFSFPPKIAVL
jgi:hypothetical protein